MVEKHKTATTYGAATLSLNQDEALLLAGYVNLRKQYFIHASLQEQLTDFVFVNSNGSQITNTSAALTAAFTRG